MKKFYTLAAVAATALTMNAQLYIVGSGVVDGTPLGWTPETPLTLTAGANGYAFKLQSDGGFKMSNAFGSWDEFNAGAIGAEVTEDALNTPITLAASDANIMMPWVGEWDITVAADLSTMTVKALTEKPAGFPAVYARGGMVPDWNAVDEWKFTTEDGVHYTLQVPETIVAGTEFKIADANWGAINYGNEGQEVFLGSEDEWTYNSGNAKMGEDFNGIIEVTMVKAGDPIIVKFTDAAGINAVNADLNAAPAVYFNLQGVKVANPENGVYVVRQGDKTSKVLVK